MKKNTYLLAILILFTQCVKEDTVKPKERIGVYGAGVSVAALTVIKYKDFDMLIEKFSAYNPANSHPPFSVASIKITIDAIEQEFSLLTGPIPGNIDYDNLPSHQVKQIIIGDKIFRIVFETFNWDADKSTDETLVVDKGRFLVEKVE